MSNGTMFNKDYKIFDPIIRNERMANIQRQLDEKKKAPLVRAINYCKEKKDKLVGELQNIAKAEEDVAVLEKELSTCEDEEIAEQLRSDIEKYKDYITNGRKSLAPCSEIIEVLTNKIQLLEAQITSLEQSAISNAPALR